MYGKLKGNSIQYLLILSTVIFDNLKHYALHNSISGFKLQLQQYTVCMKSTAAQNLDTIIYFLAIIFY